MDRLAICELESRRRALPERRSNDIAERIFGWLEEVLDGSARKIPILADGTVRTGFDVLKIRALGADVALIGRPLAQVCIGGGYVAVQPLNCHGCATKECEFRERQLERVFTRALISAKEERLVDVSAALMLLSLSPDQV